jgi:UDP-N-acetylglucosamine diphosphorylase/glucosamine-1-phosphate N-acetyltransferase
VFEDDKWANFSPLNLLKHTSLLRWGTKPLLDLLPGSAGGGFEVEAWGRDELGEVTTASEGISYNSEHRSTVLLINSRARPGPGLWTLASRRGPFAALSKSGLVAARTDAKRLVPGVITGRAALKIAKESNRLDAPPDLLFEGYWDLVESNGLAIAEQGAGTGEVFPLPGNAKVKGPPSNLRVHGRVEVEDFVSFDTRLGPVVLGEEAVIESLSKVAGPCYIGPKARVLSGLIRGGSSVFEGCKVGGEVDNSIIMPHTNKAHLGYVGDSYVGEWVNIGAGSNFSNLKNTYGNIRSNVGKEKVDTGLMKLGPAVGDLVKISIGALVFAGKKVGTGSHVTGLAQSDVPSFTYYDGPRQEMVELLIESVVDTQRRMKERRGLTLGRAEEELIRFVFRKTASERREAGAGKGRIT